MPLEPNAYLTRLFGPEVLGRLPGNPTPNPSSRSDTIANTFERGQGLEISWERGSGLERVWRTTVLLIGTYASWFTQAPLLSSSTIPSLSLPSTSSQDVLLLSLMYLTNTLVKSPNLTLPTANALRDLCDANRVRLSGYVGILGEVYTRLGGVAVSLKTFD